MASVTYGKCIMANVIMAKVFMAKVLWQMKLSHDIGLHSTCRTECYASSPQDGIGLHAACRFGLHAVCWMGLVCMQPAGWDCYACSLQDGNGLCMQSAGLEWSACSLHNGIGLHAACKIGLVCKFCTFKFFVLEYI